MYGRVIPFPWRPPRRLSFEEGRPQAERIFATPVAGRATKAAELGLEDPAVLLCVSDQLRAQLESSPANVRDECEFFHNFLNQPRREIGLFDEREYYLGEFALMAGMACRVLFRRDEARRWLARAEANFVFTANAGAHAGRVAYQRLAFLTEERQFEDVLEILPLWSENFSRLGLSEEALKCGSLRGIAYWELGQLSKAVEVFREVLVGAESAGLVTLEAQTAGNLATLYALMGETEEALACSRRALPLLTQLDNRVGLAKLQWGIGDLHRGQKNLDAAIEAYRSARGEAEEVGMRGDVAALHLVLADVLLDAGQERQAEWEIRAALPIIEEEKMVPEGIAALSLLQQSLRARRIDRQALRELHGYFRDEKA